MRLIILFTILIGSIFIISCNASSNVGGNDATTNNKDINETILSPTKIPDENLFHMRCSWAVELSIKESNFCIIGEKVSTKDEPADDSLHSDNIEEGVIKIKSIIYGNPKTEQIAYSRRYGSPLSMPIDLLPWQCPHPAQNPFFSGISMSKPLANCDVIVLGKGYGENITIIQVIWEPIISIKAIKFIKQLESISQEKFEKERNELLVSSNDIEILSYLFRRSSLKSKTENTVTLIETLYNKGETTPERKLLSYGFALRTLRYERSELNNTQRQSLVDISTKILSEIKTVKEGIKLLGLLDGLAPYSSDLAVRPSTMFGRTPKLKDKLKQITNDLSQKFKDDKDYSEWEKWVNKIFPPASPSSSEDKPSGGPDTHEK